MAEWLKSYGVKMVVMQSSGVYWIAVLRGVGAGRIPGMVEQCPGHQKSTWTQPRLDLEAELNRICGVDVRAIPGVDIMAILSFVAEAGVDTTPWRSEDHLVSWLKLAP